MFAILHVYYVLLFVYMLMGQIAFCMNKVSYRTDIVYFPFLMAMSLGGPPMVFNISQLIGYARAS